MRNHTKELVRINSLGQVWIPNYSNIKEATERGFSNTMKFLKLAYLGCTDSKVTQKDPQNRVLNGNALNHGEIIITEKVSGVPLMMDKYGVMIGECANYQEIDEIKEHYRLIAAKIPSDIVVMAEYCKYRKHIWYHNLPGSYFVAHTMFDAISQQIPSFKMTQYYAAKIDIPVVNPILTGVFHSTEDIMSVCTSIAHSKSLYATGDMYGLVIRNAGAFNVNGADLYMAQVENPVAKKTNEDIRTESPKVRNMVAQ